MNTDKNKPRVLGPGSCDFQSQLQNVNKKKDLNIDPASVDWKSTVPIRMDQMIGWKGG